MAFYRSGFLIFLLLFGVVLASSQERILSEEEFNRVEAAARKATYAAPYRSRMTSGHFDKKGGPQPFMSITETSEQQSETRHKELSITTDREGTRKVETVVIDNATFERIEDGPWKKRQDDGGNPPRVGNKFSQIPLKKNEFIFRYMGKDLVNSIDADLYESRKFREYDYGSYQQAYTIVDRFWVQANGKLLKWDTETIESDGSLSFRMDVMYEYPAKIQIVAPIK